MENHHRLQQHSQRQITALRVVLDRVWKLRAFVFLFLIPSTLCAMVFVLMPDSQKVLETHNELQFEQSREPHALIHQNNEKKYAGHSSIANENRMRVHEESTTVLSSTGDDVDFDENAVSKMSLHTAHDEEEEEEADQYKYAIVIDAGSTGSRVHVFRFEKRTGELVDDTFEQLKPGLSSYEDDAEAAGKSLIPLLEKAMETVPEHERAETPVEVRATAGLRLISPQSKADDLLESVRDVLKTYPFLFEKKDVSIMGGEDEGAFQWLALNYLLNRLDTTSSSVENAKKKDHHNSSGAGVTVAVIDLGGGSVQLAHAMDDKVAKRAPKGYSKSISFPGAKKPFEVYVKSHLGYGLMAARAATLKEANGGSSPCLPKGSDPRYVYAGEDFSVTGDDEKNSDYKSCRKHVENMLHLESECEVMDECSFNGAWGGDFNSAHAKEVYLSSYMWDRALNAKLIPTDAIDGELTLDELEDAAKLACDTAETEIMTSFESVGEKDAAFLCTDLTYIVALLEKGFEKNDWKSVRLVKQVEYRGQNVEVAWALGAALNALAAVAAKKK